MARSRPVEQQRLQLEQQLAQAPKLVVVKVKLEMLQLQAQARQQRLHRKPPMLLPVLRQRGLRLVLALAQAATSITISVA
jgi:hypothetical protein